MPPAQARIHCIQCICRLLGNSTFCGLLLGIPLFVAVPLEPTTDFFLDQPPPPPPPQTPHQIFTVPRHARVYSAYRHSPLCPLVFTHVSVVPNLEKTTPARRLEGNRRLLEDHLQRLYGNRRRMEGNYLTFSGSIHRSSTIFSWGLAINTQFLGGAGVQSQPGIRRRTNGNISKDSVKARAAQGEREKIGYATCSAAAPHSRAISIAQSCAFSLPGCQLVSVQLPKAEIPVRPSTLVYLPRCLPSTVDRRKRVHQKKWGELGRKLGVGTSGMGADAWACACISLTSVGGTLPWAVKMVGARGGRGGGGGWHKALVVGSVSLWRRLLASRL